MAISALLIVGFISNGAVLPSATFGLSQKTPQFGFFVVTVVGLGFWFLDALNKSLQLVLIHMGRDIEQAILFDIPVWSPSKARRYQMRDGRHLTKIMKNLSEQSVAPFYLIPILGAGLIFYVDFLSQKGSASLQVPEIFSFDSLAIATLASIALLFAISLYIRLRWNFGDRLLAKFSLKAKKREIVRGLIENHVIDANGLYRIRGFQFYNLCNGKTLCIDYPKTWSNESFIIERLLVASYIEADPILLNVKSLELFECNSGSTSQADNLKTLGSTILNMAEPGVQPTN